MSEPRQNSTQNCQLCGERRGCRWSEYLHSAVCVECAVQALESMAIENWHYLQKLEAINARQ